jgi:adenylate kinase
MCGLLEVIFLLDVLLNVLSEGSFSLHKWGKDCVSIMGKYVKMTKINMQFFKEKRHERFLKDGQLVAPMDSILFFCKVWDRLVESGTKIVNPNEIIWINGAPGSGKGTNTRNVMRALNISLRPIVVSELLNSSEFKAKIDNGLLVDDLEVTFLVFKRIFDEGMGRRIIVDGYPRTVIQARCIQLLQQQVQSDPIHMISIVLLIDERTSIQRQLTRGQEAMERNERIAGKGNEQPTAVRKTDMDPELARLRYNQFFEETHPALRLLKKFTDYYEIEAKGSFDEIRDRIYAALKKK